MNTGMMNRIRYPDRKLMVNSIVLLAKQSGKTSFSSLWQVKNALGTNKVGHTGTLDNFADGLLVLLAGSLTRLGNHITASDKEYLARIAFGSRTDTLDPSGTVTETAPLPDVDKLHAVLPSFNGSLDQIPPEYSAIHVDGKRASDRIRDGEPVYLAPRRIIIHSLELVGYTGPDGTENPAKGPVAAADIRVHCSKGTYIRSLARDIAIAAGSCAHTAFLRRTAVGPFRLEDAAGFNLLPAFGTPRDSQEQPEPVPPHDILDSCRPFTPELARETGLPILEIPDRLVPEFLNGKKMTTAWFDRPPASSVSHAVFSGKRFCGMVHDEGGRLVYDFVHREDS